MNPKHQPAPRRRVFVDMDGVVVDFAGYLFDLNSARVLLGASPLSADDMKRQRGAYVAMPPLPGAIEAVRELIAAGFEVWLATKPPTGVPWAYADKVQWVLDWLPELARRIILTHDKGLLGSSSDVLIDDNPENSRGQRFPGTLIRFDQQMHGWGKVLAQLLPVSIEAAMPLRERAFWPSEQEAA